MLGQQGQRVPHQIRAGFPRVRPCHRDGPTQSPLFRTDKPWARSCSQHLRHISSSHPHITPGRPREGKQLAHGHTATTTPSHGPFHSVG